MRPVPDALLAGEEGDPAAVVVARETVRLAFIAALQRLAPRQRAVLILRDVLSWRASEVAQLLESSEDAVNGTLKRARAALAAADFESGGPDSAEVEQDLLEGYINAFERYDVDALVALLHEDATLAMPPFELWLRGLADIRTFLAGMQDEGGHDRVLAIRANGCPAAAVYRPDNLEAVRVSTIRDHGAPRSRVTGSPRSTLFWTPPCSPPSGYPPARSSRPVTSFRCPRSCRGMGRREDVSRTNYRPTAAVAQMQIETR